MKSEFWDVPPGKIAAVVTHLQMKTAPAPRDLPDINAELVRHEAPDLAWYRDLYSRVGAHWMWFGRCDLSDPDLAMIIRDAAVHVYSVRVNGRDEGLLELDFRVKGTCQLGYFGLTAGMIGSGAGRWLIEHATRLAWAAPIKQFNVHTCTLDSPQALPFYMRSGFTAYRRQIEICDDPRVSGAMDVTACPQEPII